VLQIAYVFVVSDPFRAL